MKRFNKGKRVDLMERKITNKEEFMKAIQREKERRKKTKEKRLKENKTNN